MNRLLGRGLLAVAVLLLLARPGPRPLAEEFEAEAAVPVASTAAWGVDLLVPRVEAPSPTVEDAPVDYEEPVYTPPPPDVTVWGITRVEDGRVLATLQMPDGQMHTVAAGEPVGGSGSGDGVLAIDGDEVTLRINGENFTYAAESPAGDGGQP